MRACANTTISRAISVLVRAAIGDVVVVVITSDAEPVISQPAEFGGRSVSRGGLSPFGRVLPDAELPKLLEEVML